MSGALQCVRRKRARQVGSFSYGAVSRDAGQLHDPRIAQKSVAEPCSAGSASRRLTVLRFANSLFGRVVIALVIGIVLGASAPDFAVSLRPFGDGFVKLIQMIIAPLVFCVVVSGICG